VFTEQKTVVFNVGPVAEAEAKAEASVVGAKLSVWLALPRPRRPTPFGIAL